MSYFYLYYCGTMHFAYAAKTKRRHIIVTAITVFITEYGVNSDNLRLIHDKGMDNILDDNYN